MANDQASYTRNPNQQRVRLATLWSSWQISFNLLWAYTGIIAVDLGASGIEQSMVTGVQTLGNASLQGVWGSLSDRFGRRPFLFLGLFAVGMTAALIPLAQSALALILLLLVPTIIGSAAIPAWNGLLGDLTTMQKRGRFIGIITAVGTVAAAITLVAVGYIATTIGLTGMAQYLVPLYVSAAAMVIAVICTLCLHETLLRTQRRMFNFRAAVKGTPKFPRFLLVNAIFFVCMGAAWPIFPIITRGVLHASVLQVGLLTALFGICSGSAQIGGGWLTDHFGRKPILFIGRFFIFLAPLFHALGAISLNIWFLVPTNIFGGLLTGFFIVSSTAWLLDSAPLENRASVVAIYNLITGVTSFVGATISGFILDTLTLTLTRPTAVILMMLTIVVLRMVSATGYLTINETLEKAKTPTLPAIPTIPKAD